MVLMMSAILTIVATSLWNTTSLEAQIVTNQQKIDQAKLAAMSGITHFTVANFDLTNAENGELVPETPLTPRTGYRVEMKNVEDGKVMVTSWGQYRKSDQIIFEYPIRVLVERD